MPIPGPCGPSRAYGASTHCNAVSCVLRHGTSLHRRCCGTVQRRYRGAVHQSSPPPTRGCVDSAWVGCRRGGSGDVGGDGDERGGGAGSEGTRCAAKLVTTLCPYALAKHNLTTTPHCGVSAESFDRSNVPYRHSWQMERAQVLPVGSIMIVLLVSVG